MSKSMTKYRSKRSCESTNLPPIDVNDFRSYGVSKLTLNYFARVQKLLKLKFPDENKPILATNVLTESKGVEVNLLAKPMSAQIFETILPWASWKDLKGLRKAMNESTILKGCEGRFCEKLLMDTLQRYDHEKNHRKYFNYLKKISRLCFSMFESNCTNANLNQLTRVCIEICSGVLRTNGRKDPILPKLLTKFAKDISNYSFWDRCSETWLSGFLQVLLNSCKIVCPKQCSAIVDKIIDVIFKEYNQFKEISYLTNQFFDNTPRNRLLDAVIAGSSKYQYECLVSTLFRANIDYLMSRNSKCEYLVSTLITECPGIKQYELLNSIIHFDVPKLLDNGNQQVLRALSYCYLQLGETYQNKFLKDLMVALNCSDFNSDGDFIYSVLWFKEQKSDFLHFPDTLQGSLTIQNMLCYTKSIEIIHLIFKIPTLKFIKLFTDKSGSRIFDAVLESDHVNEELISAFINKIEINFVVIASDTYGSRVFDKLWRLCNREQKLKIMSYMSRKLLNTKCGKYVAKKVDLETFMTNKLQWNPRN